MLVAKAVDAGQIPHGLDIPLKGFYLLAKPDTPPEVIEAVAERSEQGDGARDAVYEAAIGEGTPGDGREGQQSSGSHFHSFQRQVLAASPRRARLSRMGDRRPATGR
jgi:hypothetical protein